MELEKPELAPVGGWQAGKTRNYRKAVAGMCKQAAEHRAGGLLTGKALEFGLWVQKATGVRGKGGYVTVTPWPLTM